MEPSGAHEKFTIVLSTHTACEFGIVYNLCSTFLKSRLESSLDFHLKSINGKAPMTVMTEEDEDSDCLYIDEREQPTSPKRQKTSDQNTITETTAPDSNKKSELRHVRKEVVPVNYLPLIKNVTLNTIKNNILNTNTEKPRITIKDFARIPDASVSNEMRDSELYHLLTESNASPLAGLEQYSTIPNIPMDTEDFRAEAPINDPRLHVTDTGATNCNANGGTAAPDYQRASGSYMMTHQDQTVPRIPQNPYGVENENIPHMPAQSMNANKQASVIVPSSGNHSGGTMAYGPPASTQRHNGNTNFPTAVNYGWPDQNGHQAQMSCHNYATAAKYNEQATANYNQRAGPPIKCPSGYPYYRPPMNRSANYPLNPHPHNRRISPYMYSMGLTYNGQRMASTNPHVQTVPMSNSQNYHWNGYGQAYGTNSVPQNTPYRSRDTTAYLAEMHKQTYLQRSSIRMESLRTEMTHVVRASGRVNQNVGVKTTKKRSYTKISTNNTQYVMSINPEVPASSTYNNVMGNVAGDNIPNWDAFGNGETASMKQPAEPNINTPKTNISIPVNNNVHVLSNIKIQPTRNNIEIPSTYVTSVCTQPSMNGIPNSIQTPLNTDAYSRTITTNTSEANIATVIQYMGVADKIQALPPPAPVSKEDNIQPIAINLNDKGTQAAVMEAPQSALNININTESAEISLIMNEPANTSSEVSSCEYVEKIEQRDIENQYQIKITTGLHGKYDARFISVSGDGSSVEQEHFQLDCSTNNTEQINTSNEENISHSQRGQDTEVLLERNRSIQDNQETKEASDVTESNKNEMSDELKHSCIANIAETLFFKFQISFFRLVQERLSENNCHKLAEELSKDIHGLIAISDDEGAKADMRYKCHVCRSMTIYSPRSLYYKKMNHLEIFLDKKQNCPLCITFKRKYIAILIRYIESESPKETAYSESISNASQRDDVTINSSNERQSHSENSLDNQYDGTASNQRENNDIENQLSLITNGVLSSTKKAKTVDQATPNAEHVPNVSNATQDVNTNDFVVKLPRNRLKESTVKALMESKNFKFNANKSDRKGATLNLALDDNSNNAYKSSGNHELRKRMIIETNIIAEQRNRNRNNSTNNRDEERCLEVRNIIDASINNMYKTSHNDKNEENCLHTRKSISLRGAISTNLAAENTTSNPSSGNKQDNNTNLERHQKKTMSSSADTNIEPQHQNINAVLNNNDNSHNSKDDNSNIRNIVSAETASITKPNHNDKNHEGHHKNKSASVNTSSSTNPELNRNPSEHNDKNKENSVVRKGINIDFTKTNAGQPYVNTNVAPNKENDNIIDAETNNKSKFSKLPRITADVARKDDANRQLKPDRRHSDTILNDGKKASGDSYVEIGETVNHIVDKALDDSIKTLKANSNSNEELPQVKISGQKHNKKASTKTKGRQALEEIRYKYRCKVCTVSFKFLPCCLNHMKKNHGIRSPVVPLHCITMRCAFCPLYVMPDLYNTHVKTAHDDKFSLKAE